MLGTRLHTRRRLSAGVLLRGLRHDLSLIRGAAIPLLALALAALAGASQEAAVSAGVWSAVGGLVGFELLAALRTEASRGELVLESCVGALMGLAILALKIILH